RSTFVGALTHPARQQMLVVRVANSNGEPVADAEFFLLDGHVRVNTTGRTDADGQWSGGVPADLKNWGIIPRKAHVGFDYVVPSLLPGSHDEMESLPEQVTLSLDGARTLRVKTVDQHDKPVAGVRVGLMDLKKPGRQVAINLAGTHPLLTDGTLW